MPDQDRTASENRNGASRPPAQARPRSAAPKKKRDLAETTGYVAGVTASGLTRILLRSKTVRTTLRNARDSIRENS